MEKSKAEKIKLIEQTNQIKRQLEADITKKCDVPLDLIISKLALKNQNDNEASKKDLYISLNRRFRAMEKDFESNFLLWRKTKHENYDSYESNLHGIQKEMINIFFVRNMIREWFAGADKQIEFSEQLQELNKKNTDLDVNIFNETIDTNNNRKIIFKNFGLYDDMDFNGLIGYVPGYFEESGEYCEGYLKIYTKGLNSFEKIFEHEWQEFHVPLIGSINFSSDINGFQDPNGVKFGNNCFFDALIILLAKQPFLHMYCMKLADKIFEPGKFNPISNSRDMFHVLKNDKIYKEMNEQYPLMIALIDYIKALHDAKKGRHKSIAPFYFRNQLIKLSDDLANMNMYDPSELLGCMSDDLEVFFRIEDFDFDEDINKMCSVDSNKIRMNIRSLIFSPKVLDVSSVVAKNFPYYLSEDNAHGVIKLMSYSSTNYQLNSIKQFKSLFFNDAKAPINLADISCCYNNGIFSGVPNKNGAPEYLNLIENGSCVPFFVHQQFTYLYVSKPVFQEGDMILPSLVKTGNNYNDYFMLFGIVVNIPTAKHYISIIRDEGNIFYKINDLKNDEKKVMKIDSSVLERDANVRLYSHLILYRRINRNIFEIEKTKGATYEDITNTKTFDFSKIFLPLFLHGSLDNLKKIMCEIGVVDEENKLLNYNNLTPDNIVGDQRPKYNDKNEYVDKKITTKMTSSEVGKDNDNNNKKLEFPVSNNKTRQTISQRKFDELKQNNYVSGENDEQTNKITEAKIQEPNSSNDNKLHAYEIIIYSVMTFAIAALWIISWIKLNIMFMVIM